MRRLVPIALAALVLAGVAGAQAPPLPSFTTIGPGPAGGLVVRGVIPGSTGRKSLIYLPPGYPAGAPYPVVYLLHGMPGSP